MSKVIVNLFNTAASILWLGLTLESTAVAIQLNHLNILGTNSEAFVATTISKKIKIMVNRYTCVELTHNYSYAVKSQWK